MNDDQALRDFVAKYARPYDPESDDYDRPPFAVDIKEGKNDPIYNAHSYHTKVPPRGIIPYILHYTRPGDLILDPFCGSGMTGVAAQMCANPPSDLLEQFPELKERVGPRHAILNDLSPAACHIAYNYNTPVDVDALRREFERIKAAVKDEFDDAEASVSVLKDYMQTGKFSRGDQEFSAQCSVVLGGNIDTDVEQREPEPHYRHLFEVLPDELQDAAFLDRIHAYLPGWEMPKIRPENYATGYGFLTDYMAEIFSELRRRNFQTHVATWVDLSGMTGRNQDAIKRTVAGLLKLQHPHRLPETLTRKEIDPLVKVAVEMRKRVTDQLAKMLPAEFGAVDYRYTLIEE